MEQLAARPDVRPINEVRPGSELLGPDNFGRFPGDDESILKKTAKIYCTIIYC